jgi:hypothetical protein
MLNILMLRFIVLSVVMLSNPEHPNTEVHYAECH